MDWLRLGDSQTKGSSYYPLRPANVIGYFSIDEGINDKLKDKTDRGSNNGIVINLNGITVREEADIDLMIGKLVKKLKLAQGVV